MTASSSSGPVVDANTPARRTVQHLRNVLRLNALTSLSSGVAMAAAPLPVTQLIGSGHPNAIRILGFGLLTFALAVLGISGTRTTILIRDALAITIADACWVGASIATSALGWYSRRGIVVVGTIATVVASLAVRQNRSRRAALTSNVNLSTIDEQPPVEVVHTEHAMPVPTTVMWPIITDHELYGRLALNLAHVEATTRNGPGLKRTCTARGGATWTETCSSWHEGEHFDVTVDTSNYPYPLAEMRGAWSVRPTATPHHCVVAMDFRFQPRPGFRGRAFAIAAQPAFKPVLRRIIRGWLREANHRVHKSAS